jgi:hypothetical protein
MVGRLDQHARLARRRVALSLGVTVVSVAFNASASAAGVTAAKVLTSTRSAIAAQTSAHVVFTAYSGSSSTTEKIIADVSNAGGTETVFEGSADVAIRLTPAFAYVSGNTSGLTELFGMSAAKAKKVGKDWVSWSPGTSEYRNLKSDLTMSPVTALLPKAKGTKLTTKMIGGVQYYLLKWTSRASASVPKLSNTLTILANGDTLPLTETAIASGGSRITTTLSKWGEAITVQAPSTASTISSSRVTG